MPPVTTTALQIINGSTDLLGIKSPSQPLSADIAQDALIRLNFVVELADLQPGMLLNEQREVFDLVAGQGTPDHPYTMGPGADFDTTRPVYVTGFGLLLNNASPPVEIPLNGFTDRAYQAIAIKSLGSTQPTGVYFNDTAPLATVYLYPIPTTALNDLVIYSLKAVDRFTTLTTPVALAPGYAEYFQYQLAQRLADPFGMAWTPNLERGLSRATTWIKTANLRMRDLALDPALTHASRKPYNILSDT